ncbi:hypothetical protein CYMTET_38055 [Cymbomonas tetramitiformis]|uniref:Uncharacterized protein n=1 Tax=Cymbomonas tetramitiformis TaxID=36881 RepID=A0AAE0CEA7_9CHLO|nr:hypothetical protein CYMTET_38055 [Cymbomonas tetramitiformis]
MEASAAAPACLTPAELIGRRVETPGVVFRRKDKVYYGRIVSRDKVREGNMCMDVRYDDGQKCWFPIITLMLWLLPPGASDEAADGDISGDASDETDPDESDTHSSDEESGPSLRREVWGTFTENKKANDFVPPTFAHGKDKDMFEEPPTDYIPGLAHALRRGAPKDPNEGMWYVFLQLLQLRGYWNKLSVYSTAYATTKGAGTDTNIAREDEERHASYEGKGKHRPWTNAWVSVKGP